MAKLNYQYQAESRMRPPRRERSGSFRLLLIFVVIAAITAGIIFLILPKKKAEEQKSSVRTPDVQQETAVEPEKTAETVQQETPAEKPVKEEVPPTPAKEETPAEKPAKEETPAEEPAKPAIPAEPEKLLTPDDFPEKGKPSPADPPETPALVPEKGENSAAWRNEAKLLTDKHVELISKRADIPGVTIRYRVRSGDSFSRIAAKNHTTFEMIKHLSGFSQKHDANKLHVGRNLRLLPGPWHIVVEKEAKLLKLYIVRSDKEELFAVWDIGIGRQDSTPAGEFVILHRLTNPPWTKPDGSIIAPGKPENPLGIRFLKLAKQETPGQPANGLGIHGTNDDSSVTKSLSNGCIRMRNADVEMLFSIVPAKTRVTIKN